MHKILKVVAHVALLIALTGCGAGRNFIRPSSDTFKLGQTTKLQVLQKMGEPGRVGDILKNEKPIKSITYVYANALGEPLEMGVIPARSLMYYFYNDTLVGQTFLSSFKSDNSNFDDTKIGSIKKGQTSRAEVIQLLGNPTALYIQPIVKAPSDDALGYTYQTYRRGEWNGSTIFIKSLRVSFDGKGIVSNVEYTSSKSK